MASLACLLTVFFFCYIVVLSLVIPSSSSLSNTLRQGESLSVEKPDDVLVSNSGIFSAGFFLVGQNAYAFAIWFNDHPVKYHNGTLVWMANRDQPVNGKRSKLSLLKGGNLVLFDAGRFNIWDTETVWRQPVLLRLADNGNLMLMNSQNSVLWQSFDSPTDTLLPLQPFTKDTNLVSSRSQSNFSSGYYTFFFDNDNVIRMRFGNWEVSSVFWPPPWLVTWDAGRSTYNNTRIATLNLLGNFSSSDDLTFLAADYGSITQRRLKIDPDGNIRLYSRKNPGENWVVSWQAFSDPCKIHGICGANGLCRYDHTSGRRCSCLPGYKMKDPTDWTGGCEPEFNVTCKDESHFLKLSNAEFYGYDYGFFPNYTLSQCQDLCLSLCNCKGFQYSFFNAGHFNCYPKTLLLNGYTTPSFFGHLYLRLPKTYPLPNPASGDDFSLNCLKLDVQELDRTYSKKHANESVKTLLWFVSGLGGIELILFLSIWALLIKNQRDSGEDIRDYLLGATGFRRFSFAELKKATKGFSEEIGRGSGGAVYKGVLSDNRVAAVKRLNQEDNKGEAEFLAEVNTIGRLNHMNLIVMWGFCAEGKHRLLVYELLEHGSLKQNICGTNALDWKKRYEIALGTAKGLAYLHEECLEWILHCDVKPQNILLDSNYNPKVADFGLSKLLKRGELNNSRFSRIRGTRGYMAPEWVSNQPITSKVDVYSYGIVVLEMLTGRSPTATYHAINDGKGDQTEHTRLVSWVRENATGISVSSSDELPTWLENILDPSMGGVYDLRKMEKLLGVALKCVEEEKDARPTMSQVVEMLQDHQ